MKIDGPGFRLAGMESYGRAATFLVMTGHERIRSIVVGLWKAAARGTQVLPETQEGRSAAERAGASGCRCP